MSSKNKATAVRLLNRDRSFNVDVKFGINFADLYHSLLSAKWRVFLGLALLIYLGINFLFGLGYFLLNPASLAGIETVRGGQRLVDCFFFSVQTIATIGYGRVSPASLEANVLVTMESVVGLMGLAVGTGLFFARFARPTARVRFSKVALITKRNGVPNLTLRMANERLNQIVDANVVMALIRKETTSEGQTFRKIVDLKLERSRSVLFSISWVLFHAIDSSSPLYGETLDSMRASESEIIVALTGIDDTFSQTIHDRYSYTPEDIVWNAKFKDVLERRGNGLLSLNLQEFDSYEALS